MEKVNARESLAFIAYDDTSLMPVSFDPPPRISRDAAMLVQTWRAQMAEYHWQWDDAVIAFVAVYMDGSAERVRRALHELFQAGALDLDHDYADVDGEFRGRLYSRLRPCRTQSLYGGLIPQPRPSIASSLKHQVYIRDRGRCRYCGTPALAGHLEHVVPHIAGGPSDLRNLVLSCTSCNGSKASHLWIPLPPPD